MVPHEFFCLLYNHFYQAGAFGCKYRRIIHKNIFFPDFSTLKKERRSFNRLYNIPEKKEYSWVLR